VYLTVSTPRSNRSAVGTYTGHDKGQEGRRSWLRDHSEQQLKFHLPGVEWFLNCSCMPVLDGVNS